MGKYVNIDYSLIYRPYIIRKFVNDLLNALCKLKKSLLTVVTMKGVSGVKNKKTIGFV